MIRLEEERKVIQDSLQKSADEVTKELAATTAKNTDLEKCKQVCMMCLFWFFLTLYLTLQFWALPIQQQIKI